MSLVVGACGPAPVVDATPTVVATTTMLGDLMANVVGDRATVEVLMPTGVDPHEYRPSGKDATAMASADLVVANGLGLEEGLADVIAEVAAQGTPVLEIAPAVEPLPFGREGGAGDDPHVWLDPVRMAAAARLVGARLAEILPDVDWATPAEAYASALEDTDRRVRSMLAAVPDDRRKLVTNHDSLGYFAARYGFEIVGVVVPGGSTMGDPSSADIQSLVDVIRAQQVPAIFVESTAPETLARAVADELGSAVEVQQLFTGSLGPPGSGADTLVGMIETDAQRIADALS